MTDPTMCRYRARVRRSKAMTRSREEWSPPEPDPGSIATLVASRGIEFHQAINGAYPRAKAAKLLGLWVAGPTCSGLLRGSMAMTGAAVKCRAKRYLRSRGHT